LKKLPFVILLFLSVSTAARQQIVDFKVLERFLPQNDFASFIRGTVDGETSTMMGFTTSWAQVSYSSEPDSNKGTVSVKITDMLNIPSYMSIPPSSMKTSRPAVSSYKKTTSYDSLTVLETYDSTTHQGKLQITLATRFLIEITGEGIGGPEILYSFLGRTDIDSLKKAALAGTGAR